MAQEYEIHDVHKLIEVLDSNDGIYLEMIEYNFAKAFELKDKRIILFPAIGSEAIIFHNPSTYHEMAKTGKFPEVKQTGRIFEEEKERLKDVELHIGYYTDLLSSKMGEEFSFDLSKEEMITLLDKFKKVKRKEELILPMGIFINEWIRKRVDGKWELVTKYTLSPYWVPKVVDQDGHVYSVWGRLEDFISQRYYTAEDFERFMLRPLVDSN